MQPDMMVLETIAKALAESCAVQESVLIDARDQHGPSSPQAFVEATALAAMNGTITKVAYDLEKAGLIDNPVKYMIACGIRENMAADAYAKYVELETKYKPFPDTEVQH